MPAEFDIAKRFMTYGQRIHHGGSGLWGVFIELLLIGAVVYSALRFLHGTRGERLLKSFGLILLSSFLVVQLVAEKLALDRIIYLYPYFVAAVVLTTLVAFQPEIRRGLIRLGESRFFRMFAKESEALVDPLVRAAASLSQKKIGALIAIQREVGLGAILETGVRLDSELSVELLETIFYPGTVLHDLGVIIRPPRVAAAACQFPIAESGELALNLGSRHRAALGLSQESDAMIIVVSEETGNISLAVGGKLHAALTPEELRARLVDGLVAKRPVTPKPSTTEAKDEPETAFEEEPTAPATTGKPRATALQAGTASEV